MKLTPEQFLHRLLRSSAHSSADKARLYGLAATGYAGVAIDEVHSRQPDRPGVLSHEHRAGGSIFGADLTKCLQHVYLDIMET